jgi:hypothetical protein
LPDLASKLLPYPADMDVRVPATTVGAVIMDRDSVKEPFEIGRLWNELTILKGVLIVSSILFLVLAFCPP